MALNLLIVDDDTDDIDIFCEAVRFIDKSIQCFTASSSEKAMAILSACAIPVPDYIFLDINMPRIDGRECLKQIKQHSLYKWVPTIICSTSIPEKERQSLICLGAFDTWIKPDIIGSLIVKLRSLLGSCKECIPNC